jgi:hypothetical protein
MSSTPGRTSWWPCDAAEHDRELNVELGEEFGPLGPYVMRVLKDLAQQQRCATVRSGFRVMRTKTFAKDTDQVREVIEFAAKIGALDDLAIDEDGRRFTCRISGWESDNARGRESIRKADQRRDLSQKNGTSDPVVPSERDMSGSVPHTIPNQTIEESGGSSAVVVAHAAANKPSVVADVVALCQEAGISSPDLDMSVLRVIDAYPQANHLQAANLAVCDLSTGRRTTPHFYVAFSDQCKDQLKDAAKQPEADAYQARRAERAEALRSLQAAGSVQFPVDGEI